jgi:predicted metalloprotease
MGPFYCPNDQTVYLDTDFFRVMEDQLGARGDFAKAYVIAHEVGHHVQDELGLLSQVNALRGRASERESNALSVRIELQADCYAGIWGRAAQERLQVTDEDVRDALDTAARIGDDALQRASRGRVVPDSFTHGSSEQRQEWFYRGFQTGDPEQCDTFTPDRI